jgi:hypothetical protein
MMVRSGVPIGTSMSPVFLILPASAKTFVPLLFSVPMPAYHLPPRRTIGGMLAKVSTLLISVGWPHRPFSAGNGGRGRGEPRLPSMSHERGLFAKTKAPAPMRGRCGSQGDSRSGFQSPSFTPDEWRSAGG